MHTLGFLCKSSISAVCGALNVENSSYTNKKNEWLKLSEDNIVIEQECNWINTDFLKHDGSSIFFDEEEYVLTKQGELVTQLESYRWCINRDAISGYLPVMHMNSKPIFCNELARQRLYQSVQAIKEKGYTEEETFLFKNIDGTRTNELYKDAASWVVALAETEQVFFEQEENIEKAILVLSTKVEIDSFDPITELDLLVKPILQADLTKYAYPEKYKQMDA